MGNARRSCVLQGGEDRITLPMPTQTSLGSGAWAAASQHCIRGALASDAALAVYLRRLAELCASELLLQDISRREGNRDDARSDASFSDISCSDAQRGSVKLGPSSRARNSLGLVPVQRRKAR
jgi:hypothetical protein